MPVALPASNSASWREALGPPRAPVTPPAVPPMPPDGADSPGSADVDERLLIERCRAGDIAAFEPLVEKYRQRVWRLAFQVLRDREEAWDCAQDTFVRAFQSLASFRGQSAFYTWLFRIAMNGATDRLRARSAQARAFGNQPVPAEEWERTAPDPGARPDQAALGAERRLRIRQALDTLPPNARTIIMLSDVEGLSYREIASVLNCPIGTVMSRLHNARKRLRSALGPMLLVLAYLAAALGAAVWMPARAQAPAAAKPMVHFEVRVLQASNPRPRSRRPGRAASSRRLLPAPPPAASPTARWTSGSSRSCRG